MYLLPREGGMKVPGLLVASEKLLQEVEIEKPLEQVRNVAHLEGIVGYSIAMPDIHWGYGFPIGGVAAMDAQNGVISPGGVGYDINCGVRLALIPIAYKDLTEKVKEELLKRIYSLVPSGVGRGQRQRRSLSDQDYNDLLHEGANWSVRKGMGFQKDLDHSESNGKLLGADSSVVSREAKERGREQLGTIGSGNHFCEIGAIEKVLLSEIASKWGVVEGQTYALIHSGSRGFGHQVCTDTLKIFLQKGYDKGLPDRQLVSAPIQSVEGKNYFAAMAAAANFAFNNRQQILHEVRQAFFDVCKIPMDQIHLLYDVCHNIAKFEEHLIDGKVRKVCVHRKGATRSYGKNAHELSPLFKETGQPVLVPGDMERASYLLRGLGNPTTFSSCCHGAGRAQSRVQSAKKWQGVDLVAHMKQKGILVKGADRKTISEEMSTAYKNVTDVVEAVNEAQLADIVARLKPYLVLKG